MILMKGTLIQFEIRALNSSVFLKSTVLSLTLNHKRFCSKVNNDVRVQLKKKISIGKKCVLSEAKVAANITLLACTVVHAFQNHVGHSCVFSSVVIQTYCT